MCGDRGDGEDWEGMKRDGKRWDGEWFIAR